NIQPARWSCIQRISIREFMPLPGPGGRAAVAALSCLRPTTAALERDSTPGGSGLSCPAVTTDRFRDGWLTPALLLAGLASRYAGALGSGFVNDDYLFLESVHRHGLWGALLHPAGLANYFRPLSRELWFGLLGAVTGGEPLLFHVVQFGVFAAALALLA